MQRGRSNQGPAKEDAPPDSGFNEKQTRQGINDANSRRFRQDYEETPADFSDVPEDPAPSAPTIIRGPK